MTNRIIAAAALSLTLSMNATAQTIAEPVAPEAPKYSANILAIAPIQLSENGVAGFGLSYERSLDKNGIVALYVPFSYVMNTNSQNRLGSGTNYADPMAYLMPGIKIYPTGNQGLAKYAIGPSLVLATGQHTDMIDISSYSQYPYGYPYYYGPNYIYQTRTRNVLGMMINQSLNINPTKHLYIGTEFGFGFSYINTLDGTSQSTAGLVQFSFKIGYRF